MPVILHPGDFDRWLSREELTDRPLTSSDHSPPEEMEAFGLSSAADRAALYKKIPAMWTASSRMGLHMGYSTWHRAANFGQSTVYVEG